MVGVVVIMGVVASNMAKYVLQDWGGGDCPRNGWDAQGNFVHTATGPKQIWEPYLDQMK